MKEVTWRSFIVGLFGLVLTTSSSMYVALRLGALPWPTVFVTILAMTALSKCRNCSIQEINVCHTMMSSGSMVAGGLAFTLPGIWILYPDIDVGFSTVIIVTVCGSVLGTMFSWLFRKSLIEDRKLAFPIGNAAYETLANGIKRGRKSVKLFVSMGISVVFTFLRDSFCLFPSVLTFGENFSMWLSPMAMSIGAMIDGVSVILWAVGTVLGSFILAGLGIDIAIRQSLGIGIMLGTGVAFLVKAFIRGDKKETANKIEKKQIPVCLITIALISIVLAAFTEVKIYEAIVACIGICIVSLLSGLLTGQSGINPMEVFGIIITLFIGFIFRSSKTAMFIIASTTAVSCGLSGDVMNDFKSGNMLGTNPDSQLVFEGIGGIIGAVVSVVSLFVIKASFGTFGTELLPAPQASAVASMIGGFGDTKVIVLGLAIGFAITIFGCSAATLGLGIYLSVQISSTVVLGALIAFACRKLKCKNDDITLVSSGLLGGEGVAGVVSAIVAML